MLFNSVYYHSVGDGIFAALGNYYVRALFRRLNECLVHRLYGSEILRNYGIESSSALFDVAHNSSQNSKDKQEEKSKDKKNFDDFLTGAIYEKQEGDSVKVLKR